MSSNETLISRDAFAFESALLRIGLHLLGRVKETGGATDHAVQSHGQKLFVVRLVERIASSDYEALSEMLRAGDFDRAILVHCQKEGSVLSDEVETWWIGDIEELAASLAASEGMSS